MGASRQVGGGIIEGINVTPLVDITLVLLIIFIVTAKMVVAPAIPLDLPAASSGKEVDTFLTVTIPAHGPVLVDDRPIDDTELNARARDLVSHASEPYAVLHAGGDVAYQRVIDVLDRLRSAGIERIAFAVATAAPSSPGRTPANGHVPSANIGAENGRAAADANAAR